MAATVRRTTTDTAVAKEACAAGAHQQMRWSPKGAHLMLKVRTAVTNGTLADDHVAAERWGRRPFLQAA